MYEFVLQQALFPVEFPKTGPTLTPTWKSNECIYIMIAENQLRLFQDFPGFRIYNGQKLLIALDQKAFCVRILLARGSINLFQLSSEAFAQ